MGRQRIEELADALWRSWLADEGIEAFNDLLAWITERNASTPVDIKRITLNRCAPWSYNEQTGRIANPNGSFFQIAGLEQRSVDIHDGSERVVAQQPVLIQDEIGYLGIIVKVFDGVAHLLMQAKIEPGNVNKVQISPTVQATRSNFMQLHGGRRPAYLEYFLRTLEHTVIVDQIQSEQSARFLGKRNRNVMVLVDDELDVLPTHRWMTIGQIKRLMRHDNLVNMDTRTVLSCIPWSFWSAPDHIWSAQCNTVTLRSITKEPSLAALNEAYAKLNDIKMFDTSHVRIIPLSQLTEWEMRPNEIRHRASYPFRVIFCDISIEGREVKHWNQPLFEARGIACFGLICCNFNGIERYLVRCRREIGCFDKVELGPTLQREAHALDAPDRIDEFFLNVLEAKQGISHDVLLSEEGGRFFHEQNRNVILKLDRCPDELMSDKLPADALWLDFATLNVLLRANNVLNIQLRNLLSLVDIRPRS